MDREDWQFINSFADWFAALGTVAAVVTSLYLARRQERPHLTVHAGIYQLFTVGEKRGSPSEYVQIKATNTGFREVTITGIVWRAGFFRKLNFIQLPPSNVFSASVPTKIGHGEEATYLFPVENFVRGSEQIRRKISEFRIPALARKSLRVGISSSTGHVFWSKVPDAVQKLIAPDTA